MSTINRGTKASRDFSLLVEAKKLFKSQFYDSYFITEYGKLETARSERYGSYFSILAIYVDSFINTEKMKSKKELLTFLRNVVTITIQCVRTCDVVGMLEDRIMLVILPQTDHFGALTTIRKLSQSFEDITGSQTGDRESSSSIIFSHATYPKDASGYADLLNVVMKRINNQRESLWEKLDLKSKLYWEIVETLTSTPQEGTNYFTFDLGSGQNLSENFIDKTNEVILREIMRTSQKKGILFLSMKNNKLSDDIVDLLSSVGSSATKIFVVGNKDEDKIEYPNSTTIYLGDNRLNDTLFTIFFTEDIAYTIFCKESWGDTHSCFHSADPHLVEGLITKFQRDYALQEQY